MNVNYMWLNNSVVLNYDGKTVTIAKGDERFDKVMECIQEGRESEIPDLIDYEKHFKDQGLTLVNGLIHVEDTPMPSELSDRILKFKEHGLPYKILLNFWDNLKQNPSFDARKMLFNFLEHNGHP